MPRRNRKGEGSLRYRKDLRAYEIRIRVAGEQRSFYLKGPKNRENDRAADLLRRKLALAYGLTGVEAQPPFLLEWLEAHAEALKAEGRRDNTFYHYLRYTGYIRQFLGNPRLDGLTTERVEAFYRHLANQGYSYETIAHTHNFLKSAYERALRYGKVLQNPVAQAKLPKAPKKEAGRELTEEELAKILEAARQHRLFPLFYLAAAFGLRRGEVLGLTWPDIDLEKGELHIRRALVKDLASNKPILTGTKTPTSNRTIPLTEEAIAILEEHRQRLIDDGLYQPNGLVFPSLSGTPIRPENLKRAWKSILNKAGVKYARLHDLRGTFLTRVIRQTGNPKLAAALAGHKTLSTTLKHYTHISQEELKSTLRSLQVLPKDKDPEDN